MVLPLPLRIKHYGNIDVFSSYHKAYGDIHYSYSYEKPSFTLSYEKVVTTKVFTSYDSVSKDIHYSYQVYSYTTKNLNSLAQEAPAIHEVTNAGSLNYLAILVLALTITASAYAMIKFRKTKIRNGAFTEQVYPC
jgi:hypothetical protein